MNKSELVSALSEKTGLTKKECDNCLGAFIETITETLQKQDKVSLVGFGTFEDKERAERQGINPQTKEKITIPASNAPVFKAGKALKDSLN